MRHKGGLPIAATGSLGISALILLAAAWMAASSSKGRIDVGGEVVYPKDGTDASKEEGYSSSSPSADEAKWEPKSFPVDSLFADRIRFYEARLTADVRDPLAVKTLAKDYLVRLKIGGRKGDHNRIRDLLEQWKLRYPDDPDYRAAQAGLYLYQHHFNLALQLTDPAHFPAADFHSGLMLRRFDALLNLGRLGEADSLIRDSGFDRETLGWLAAKARFQSASGEPVEALDTWKRALRRAGATAQHPVVQAWCRVEMARALSALGKTEEARHEWQAALELVPDYPAALEDLAGVSKPAETPETSWADKAVMFKRPS